MEGLLAMFMILIPVSVVSYVPSRLCDGNACNVDWTPVPNMGAALVGYNPVLSNTLKASDPGMKAMIFAPTFTRPAPDNRVEVNPNILYFDDIHCQMSRATRVVTSYQDYAQQRTGSFNFFSTGTKTSSFKIPLFFLLINYEKKTSETKSSSTDSSFQKDVKFFKDQGGEVYLNQAKCLVYKIEIDEFAKPVFTNGFKRAVKVLADEAADPKRRAKKTELRRFIGHFGTHYLSKSWLGATLSVESRFDRQSTSQGERNQRSECIGSAYSKSVNKGVRLNTFNVKLAKGDSEISTQIGGQGFGTGNGNGESKLKCSSFDELKKGGAGSSFSGTTVTSVGSYPESDPDEWAKTAGNNPKVIDFELKPIADLFRYYFLDDIDGLKGKAPLLKKYFEDAVKEYCQTMLGEDCPDTKGCGYQDLCPLGKTCVDDKSNSLGFVCATDCEWGSWGPWSNICSAKGTNSIKTTGMCKIYQGQVFRKRTKTEAIKGGKPCLGSNTEAKDCSHSENCQCNGGDDCCGTNGYKCGLGEGDCDKDSDCKDGLVCGSENCVGAGFDKWDDCCTAQKCHGGDDCCGKNGYKCDVGEGDCDKDSDCKDGLVCGSENCVGAGFDKWDDCCTAQKCHGGDDCCGKNGYKCDVGEGDCDKDSDCKDGLVCGSNNCVGAGFESGLGSQMSDDCCAILLS